MLFRSVTRLSPFELNYGMIPLSPGTLGIPQKCPSAANFLASMQDNLRLAKNKLSKLLRELSFMLTRKDLVESPMKKTVFFSKFR